MRCDTDLRSECDFATALLECGVGTVLVPKEVRVDSSNLDKFIGIVRSRKWLIIVPTLVIAITTVTVSALQPSLYRGEVELLVTPGNTGTTLLGSPQLQGSQSANFVETQVAVMQSRTIVELAIRALDLSATPEDLLKRVTVTEDLGTDVVTIDVTDTSPTRAADTANALAQAYVTWSRDQQAASIKAAADDVERRLTLAQDGIVSIEATVAAHGSNAVMQAQLEAARALYASLADKLEQLREYQQLETGSGSVLTAAVPDAKRVSPVPSRDGALAAAVGLMLGFGAAFLADALDTTLKTGDEVREIYDAPVLANIPTEKTARNQAPQVALMKNPVGPGAEAYRVLRNNLGFINFGHDIKTLLITSAAPDEGKSTVAANLAIALSSAGKKVALVICDFHRPAAAQFFDVDQTMGLSDFLAGATDLHEVLKQPAGFGDLWILPSGRIPPNPSELLGSSKMEQLVANLRESVDWVILDSAPLLAVADAAASAQWVDGILLVVHTGVSTRESARKARAQLDNVGARILGVALWGLEDATIASSYFQGYSVPSAE
jgi:non-specific protein-tyrosine kinase